MPALLVQGGELGFPDAQGHLARRRKNMPAASAERMVGSVAEEFSRAGEDRAAALDNSGERCIGFVEKVFQRLEQVLRRFNRQDWHWRALSVAWDHLVVLSLDQRRAAAAAIPERAVRGRRRPRCAAVVWSRPSHFRASELLQQSREMALSVANTP